MDEGEIVCNKPRCRITIDAADLYFKNGYPLSVSKTGRYYYRTPTGKHPMYICKTTDCWSNATEGYAGYCRACGIEAVGPNPYVEGRIAYNKKK